MHGVGCLVASYGATAEGVWPSPRKEKKKNSISSHRNGGKKKTLFLGSNLSNRFCRELDGGGNLAARIETAFRLTR